MNVPRPTQPSRRPRPVDMCMVHVYFVALLSVRVCFCKKNVWVSKVSNCVVEKPFFLENNGFLDTYWGVETPGCVHIASGSSKHSTSP